MFSNIPRNVLESLTIKDLETLLDLKKKDARLQDLLRDRERLRLELRRIEDSIEAIERLGQAGADGTPGSAGPRTDTPVERALGRAVEHNFLVGKRRKNLKDYIAQVLLDAGEPLSPSDIQKRLPGAGYESSSTNPRSFYNTVFQALQRYEAFEKEGKKYRLADHTMASDSKAPEILPRNKTRLKDFIVEVLSKSGQPLKVSEIASRVVISGYETELGMEELVQRVAATLKKYLNKDFDWDSQRYRLAAQN